MILVRSSVCALVYFSEHLPDLGSVLKVLVELLSSVVSTERSIVRWGGNKPAVFR